MPITYEKLNQDESQYDGIDLSTQTIVEARYVPNFCAPGNPLIEALPKVKSDEALMMEYNRAVLVPSKQDLAKMSVREKLLSIRQIDYFRTPLPFYALADECFYNSVISAYSAKRWDEREESCVQLTIEGETVITKGISRIARVSEPAIGFAILGTSGCGKSTCVNMILDRYPQVIVHRSSSGSRIYQVVYLHVNCQANSNMKAFFVEFGHELDRALGNISPVYEQIIRKAPSLGQKIALVRQLIERFSIGIIVMDEIELMDFSSIKESSFETIMTLTNETGTAIVAVGTDKAYKKLFGKRRTARRVGNIIHAEEYCKDRDRFGLIVKQLTLFQWRENRIYYTEEMIDTLFECSNGIISDLISLYKLIEQNYVRGKEKNGLTPEVIRGLAKEHQKELRDTTIKERNSLLNPYSADIDKELQQVEELFDPRSEKSRMEAERRYDEKMASRDLEDYLLLQEDVISDLVQKTKYSQKKIEDAFKKVMREEKFRVIPKEDAVRKVLKCLKDKDAETAEKKTRKKADPDEIRRQLLENQEESK